MAATSTHEETHALVHEGWNHLMSQRPLAAWGTWQRAIRLDPDATAARRRSRRSKRRPTFPWPHAKSIASVSQRPKRGGRSGTVFCATAKPRSSLMPRRRSAAWPPRSRMTPRRGSTALCLAWAGLDRQAIECLDQVAGLEADSDPKKAVEAWVLAEILRQAGGAESLSDDLRYACTFAWSSEQTESLRTSFPEIRQIPTPRDPTRPEASLADLEVLEWLDRPFPPAETVHGESDLPRVLATVYITPGAIRLSSPRVETLELAEEKLRRMLGAAALPVERVASPLPLPFLDADVWTTRIPEGLDRDIAHGLAREAIESYYENQWIHRPRQGLDGLSPLAASQDARRGDAVARVKLEAVVQVREQLGSRSSTGIVPGLSLRPAPTQTGPRPSSRRRRRYPGPLLRRSRRASGQTPTTSTTSAWWRLSSPRPACAMMSSPPGSPRSCCAASRISSHGLTFPRSTLRWSVSQCGARSRRKHSTGSSKPVR